MVPEVTVYSNAWMSLSGISLALDSPIPSLSLFLHITGRQESCGNPLALDNQFAHKNLLKNVLFRTLQPLD